jgi:hypothetical protein
VNKLECKKTSNTSRGKTIELEAIEEQEKEKIK